MTSKLWIRETPSLAWLKWLIDYHRFILIHHNLINIGRLSREEIDRMVKDAEKYKDEDERQRERLQAKNSLEGYAFAMKSTVEDDKLKDKISAEDKQTVLDRCNEVIRWIDNNQVCNCLLSADYKWIFGHVCDSALYIFLSFIDLYYWLSNWDKICKQFRALNYLDFLYFHLSFYGHFWAVLALQHRHNQKGILGVWIWGRVSIDCGCMFMQF